MNFEFQEVFSKKTGTRTIFCNIEDLLRSVFNNNNIDEIKALAPNSGEEIICHCPFCKAEGHTKHKLYIKNDLSVGHCFVCGRAFVNVDTSIDLSFDVPDFLKPSAGSEFNLVTLQDPTWSLDKYNYEFDDYDEVGIKYLESRHPFMKDLWKPLEFKFWDGNVVMPFKFNNDVFYYQIRFSNVTHDSKKPRYFLPPMPNGTKPPYIIEVGDCRKFIICEGIFDAISLLIQAPQGFSPFAVMGSSISDYQLGFLRRYVPTEIIIYMDETAISKRIKARLESVIGYCPISIVKSNGEDPEENMVRRLKTGKPLRWIKSLETLNYDNN